MKVINRTAPNDKQIAQFQEPGPEPIYMVNLLKFKEKAVYEDGRPTDLTGRQAYALYTVEVRKLLESVGGKSVFKAHISRLMMGEVEELWDEIAIAMYPSRAAMLGMMGSARMQEIRVHRLAGLAGQLNIETGEAEVMGLLGP